MADESITRMNLSAIKKIDPYAKGIVDSSSHVAFYTFNSQQNEWEKTDVEGAFFIYHRNAEPFHSIFINNRLNTTSFVEPITGSLELQSQPPFLLYRNERSRIRGFWFYNSEECDRISNLVNSLLQNKDGNEQQHVAPPNPLLDQPKSEKASIFNMLTKAQQEYNAAQLNFPNQNSVNSENATPCNVLKFFESAKQASSDVLFNKVQPLSVDQLEKQQRVATPNERTELNRTSECRLSPFQKASASVIGINSGKPFSLLSETVVGNNSVNSNPKTSALFQSDECTSRSEQCLRKLLVGDPPNNADAKPALMPPSMFDAPNAHIMDSTPLAQQQSSSQPLNSAQFVQAFLHLLHNDKEFVNRLHKAYLKSCSNAFLDTSTTYQ